MLNLYFFSFWCVTWFEQILSPTITTKEIEEANAKKGEKTPPSPPIRNIVKGKSHCEKAQMFLCLCVWMTGALYIHSFIHTNKQTNKTNGLCVWNLYGDCQCYLNKIIKKEKKDIEHEASERASKRMSGWISVSVNECMSIMYVCML